MSDNRKRPVPSDAPEFPSKRANRLSYGMDRLSLNNDEALSTRGFQHAILVRPKPAEPHTANIDQAVDAVEVSPSIPYAHHEQSAFANEPYTLNRPQEILSRFLIISLMEAKRRKANLISQNRPSYNSVEFSRRIQWTQLSTCSQKIPNWSQRYKEQWYSETLCTSHCWLFGEDWIQGICTTIQGHSLSFLQRFPLHLRTLGAALRSKLTAQKEDRRSCDWDHELIQIPTTR